MNKEKIRKGILKLFPNGREISEDQMDIKGGSFWFFFEFTSMIQDKKISIQFGLPKHFPLRLPKFYLKHPNQLGFIPHLERNGFICYTFETGLILDEKRPIEIIEDSWMHARDILENGLLKTNTDDLYADFEILWNRQSSTMNIDSFIEPNDMFQEVIVLHDPKNSKGILMNADSKEQEQMINAFYKPNKITEWNKLHGIYIPMRKKTRIKPPPFNKFWSVKEFRAHIYKNITGSTKKKLNRYLKHKTVSTSKRFYVFFSIPFESEVIFVGVCFYNDEDNGKNKVVSHPLKRNDSTFLIIPASIKRHNTNYLLKRTIGNTDLAFKNVAIVGLGSLGSSIAFELAKTGIESLLLIDNDILDADNIYRHALGADMLYHNAGKHGYTGISKVEAMKIKLQSMYPAVKVDYETEDVLDIINESFDLLKEKDLVIVAIGEPTLELYLNDRIYSVTDSPPVIYTWIDPMGIGGHSILTNNESKHGCLRCIYTSPIVENKLVYNRASFVTERQQVSKTMLGCGSTFTPYGSVDAAQTSLLSTRLAIQTLSQKVESNPLRSWKDINEEVLLTGLETSRRYNLSSEEMLSKQYEYKTVNCPVCQVGIR